MTEQAEKPSKRRRRWTISGVLSGAAAIATILGLFITSGHSSSSTASDQASAPQYPASVQASYMNGCEVNASVSACQCTLDWLEANVSLAQFRQDEALAQAGQDPADVQDAVAACS